jgi:uncharacterized protein YebE (UPF0316 family)
MTMPLYLPILIFLARIVDVSVGTMRIMMVIEGRRAIAATLGFIEVAVWILAVGGALAYLDNPLAIIGYAGGFAAGVYVGMLIEHRLKMGYRVVRAINIDRSIHLAAAMRERGWRATKVHGEGRDGEVEIVFSAVRRRRLKEMLALINELAPDAWVTVERVEMSINGDADPVPRVPFARLGGLWK